MKAKGLKLPQDLNLFLKKKNLVNLVDSVAASAVNKTVATVGSDREGLYFWFELKNTTAQEQLPVKIRDGGDWRNIKVLIEYNQSMKRTYYKSRGSSHLRRFVVHFFAQKLMLVVYHSVAENQRKKCRTNTRPRGLKRSLENALIKEQRDANVPFITNYPPSFIHSNFKLLRALALEVFVKAKDFTSATNRVTEPNFGDLYVFKLSDLTDSGLLIRQDGKDWSSFRTKRETCSESEKFFCNAWIKIYSEIKDSSSKKCVITFSKENLALVYYYKLCCGIQLSAQQLQKHLALGHSRSLDLGQPECKNWTLFLEPVLNDSSFYAFENLYKSKIGSIIRRLKRGSGSSTTRLLFPRSGSIYAFEGNQKEQDLLDGCKWKILKQSKNERISQALTCDLHLSLDYLPEWDLTIARYFELCPLCQDAGRYGEDELEKHIASTHSDIFCS